MVDLVVQLTHADPAEIGPETFLKDVGIDSLLTVELAEELGRRYDTYLSDETVDGLRTVQDAVRAVESHQGAAVGASARPSAGLAAVPLDDSDLPADRGALKSGAISTAITMTIIGAVIGGVLGFGVMTAMSATGLNDAALPPLSASPTPEPTKSSTPSPTPAPPQDDAEPQPVLTTPKDRVAPGERFALTGTFPGAGEGAELQVQVKEGDTPWDNFPVTTPVRAGDTFETQVYTSRTGTRQFRMLLIGTDRATPEVTVTIG